MFLPPFVAVRAFDAVFRCGGVRRAARLLDVHHTVISRHLRLLEDTLGVVLIDRSGHGLALTDEGRLYHARVSSALSDLRQATQDLLGERETGPVRLWCAPGLAMQWLSARIGEFEAENPEIQVELKSSDRPANLSIHEADADIRFINIGSASESLPRGYRALELASPRMIAVATPAQSRRFEDKHCHNDVSNWPLLHEENRDEWKFWLEKRGFPVPSKMPGVLCWHAHLLIAAAREGRGIALANRFLVQDDLESGRLVEMFPDASPAVTLGRYVWIAREDQWSMPRLVRLRTFLRNCATQTVEADQRLAG